MKARKKATLLQNDNGKERQEDNPKGSLSCLFSVVARRLPLDNLLDSKRLPLDSLLDFFSTIAP